MSTIQTLSSKRGLWLLLTAIALLLEGGALYLQHVLQVEPCNECIFVRTGVLGIAVAGLIGAVAPKYLAMRLAGLVACIGALAWSLYRVALLLDLERVVSEGGEASCKRFRGFPDWMPLDTWLPDVFQPRAMCGTVSWTFVGQSVTFWIGVALLGIALAATSVLLSQLVVRDDGRKLRLQLPV
jgi:disulfide bond formation protein DsbB